MSKNVRRLYEGFAPEHYQLFLEPDATTKKARGHITITGQKKGRPSQRLTFHQHYLHIISAKVVKHDKKGDADIEIVRINKQNNLNEVRLHADTLLYAGKYTITLEFEALVQDGMHGIYKSDYKLGDETKYVISTQLESHSAREAFPCIDEPEAKATFDLTLSVDKELTALSNMPAANEQEIDGRRHVTFQTTPRMSSYLVAFVVGDLQCRETKTKDNVQVRVWSTKAHSLESLDFSLDIAKQSIEFFNDYFGTPYPLPKSDHVAIPNFAALAMENWGLITYREVGLVAEPGATAQSSRELISMVICHEMSHMWFGDLVTMKWWNDLWLNESFANMMEYIGTNAIFPDWHIFNLFVVQEGLAAFRRDAIPGVQPIKVEVHHPDEIGTLFDPSIVYAKGGRLLNMLRRYIGEADFRKGLKAYFAQHAYKNTVGGDLWEALHAVSGKDVSAIMNPWLQQSNFPVITVDQQDTHVTISQSHFVLDQAKADPKRLWPVPLLATTGKIPALLETAEAKATLDSGDYIRINQDAVGHYIVHYKQSEHAEAIAQLAANKTLNDAERLTLLSDSSLLARNGRESFAATLTLLEHYSAEDSEPVWDIMALVLADARRFIDANPAIEDAVKALMRELIEAQYQRLGWEEQQGEQSADTKLRATILGMGVYAGHEAIVAEATRRFEEYKTNPNVVSAELRGILFGAAVRYAVPGAFDWLLDYDQKVANPDIKQDIMGGLTTTRLAEEGTRLLARLQDKALVRLQDVDHWLIYLMRNRHTQEVAWQWLQGNWEWIEKTFAGDKSYDVFPRYAASAFNTRQRLQEYKDFFGPKQSQPVLTRNVTMGIEEIESRVAWIERDLAGVQSFFNL